MALQALYQWRMAGASIATIESEFHVDNDMSKVDTLYFRELLHGVAAEKSELDALYEPYLDRPRSELDPVEEAILRLCTYEFSKRLDVPYRVVINEGIEMAKKFGATEGHRFVNGVLDKLARKLRAAELRNKR